jgi:hypothetical protein
MENAINIPEMKFPLSLPRVPLAPWIAVPKTAAETGPVRHGGLIGGTGGKRIMLPPQDFPPNSFYAALTARPVLTLAKMKALAQQFIAGHAAWDNVFIGGEAQLPAALNPLPQVLLLARRASGGLADLRQAVAALFGFPDGQTRWNVQSVLGGAAYRGAIGQIWQSYFALLVNADFDDAALVWLGKLLLADYILKQLFVVFQSIDIHQDAYQLQQWLAATVALPGCLFPLPAPLSAAGGQADEDNTDDAGTGATGEWPDTLHWADKATGARVLRSGGDTVIEFTLHQPASHYIAELQGRKGITMPMSLVQLGVPSSNEIGAHNYTELAALYDVGGLAPPPASTVNRSVTLAYGEQKLLHLPAGYYVSNASVNFFGAIDGDRTPGVLVGRESIRVGDSWTQPRSFGQEYAILATFPAPEPAAGPVPAATLPGQRVSVEVECTPSPGTLQEWRLKTYEAIFRAYQKQALQAVNQHGVGIGRNRVVQSPRQIERTQLRQACLRLLHRRAVEPDGAARGKAKGLSDATFRRFAEHTFDWPAMRVCFYANGGDRANDGKLIELRIDQDADLTAFLEADLAKVRVPVRPEHVLGLLYFLETGQRWKADATGDPGDDMISLE